MTPGLAPAGSGLGKGTLCRPGHSFRTPAWGIRCQRTSEAASAVSASEHDTDTLTYVDDTGGLALPEVALDHYYGLLQTLDMLGLQTAPDKCQPPATQMLWIGVWYDSVRMLMAIDRERIREALSACEAFLAADKTTLHALQKLLGKLFHATKCTVAARAFLSRLLDLLRVAGTVQLVIITPSARADTYWLLTFLYQFNGLTLIKPSGFQHTASVDSCLKGAGGWCVGLGNYSVEYPEYIQTCDFCIAGLECFNLLMAVRLWIQDWSGCRVEIFCDNWATPRALVALSTVGRGPHGHPQTRRADGFGRHAQPGQPI